MSATIAYIPPSLSSTLAALTITGIKVAAHLPDEAWSGKKTNHWVLHFVLSQNESVRFDLSPTGPDCSPGCLIVRELDYTVSSNAVKTCDLSVRGGLTVQAIIDLLRSAHYDRYKFSATGQGCRFWVDSVVALLLQHDFLAVESEAQSARAALQKV